MLTDFDLETKIWTKILELIKGFEAENCRPQDSTTEYGITWQWNNPLPLYHRKWRKVINLRGRRNVEFVMIYAFFFRRDIQKENHDTENHSDPMPRS